MSSHAAKKFWLDINGYEQYLIIDDDSDMLKKQKEQFLQINAAFGFTDNDLKSAIKMLTSKNEKIKDNTQC